MFIRHGVVLGSLKTPLLHIWYKRIGNQLSKCQSGTGTSWGLPPNVKWKTIQLDRSLNCFFCAVCGWNCVLEMFVFCCNIALFGLLGLPDFARFLWGRQCRTLGINTSTQGNRTLKLDIPNTVSVTQILCLLGQSALKGGSIRPSSIPLHFTADKNTL